MPDLIDFSTIENLSVKDFQKNSDLIIQTLLKNLSIVIGLDPYQINIKFKISKNEGSEENGVFSRGVNRYTQANTLVVEIYDQYLKFLPFILLREIYNLFVPSEIKDFEVAQMVINQIIMINLSNSVYKNEWRTIFRENLEQLDLLYGGFNRLTAFDRLESFFKYQKIKHNPTRFFFHFIRGNYSELSNKIEDIGKDIHTIFFDEFETYLSKSMNNDEIIETIRCLIKIFYKVKRYRDLKSYKGYFQEFKKNNQLQTELSLRKFVKNMEWVKNESFLAPSYHINWNNINVCVILVYFRFNPLLDKSKIFRIISTLPFFLAPQVSRSTFCLDIFCYFILPKAYLKDLYEFIGKLKNSGYIIEYRYFIRDSETIALNLNYLRQYSQKHCIINPTHQSYDNRYETEFKIKYGAMFYETELNLLDFLLLDRIRFLVLLDLVLKGERIHYKN